MADRPNLHRRDLLKTATLAGAALAAGSARAEDPAPDPVAALKASLKGNIRHSVCRWCFGSIPMEAFCQACKDMGIESVEILHGPEFPVIKKYGLMCAMTHSHGVGKGLCQKENHEECLKKVRESIDYTSAEGWPNVITFSGNANGTSPEEGLDNCEAAIKQIIGYAEDKKVTICMELLNSKRDHKGYMCDNVAWGKELVDRVGSDRFKLLYDIYHMQIMEGDVIQTIRDHHAYFGHYHTAGVPGRHEIDDTQELYYPAIMRAIVETGYKGHVAQEFRAVRDPLTSLRESIAICDV